MSLTRLGVSASTGDKGLLANISKLTLAQSGGVQRYNHPLANRGSKMDDHANIVERPHLGLSTSDRQAAILRLVADPFKYGHRDRVPVDIQGIKNRTLIDDYFLKLYDLEIRNASSTELEEHKTKLSFFQAYYLLAYGYYTEIELKGHPGVKEIVRGMRERGQLQEGEDIEYAGPGGAGRERGYSGSSAVKKEKVTRGLLRRLLSIH